MGLKDNFPWIFGIFSAYEPESEIRGFYSLTNERIKLAKADKACKGVVLWPELSHGDPLITEYLAVNSWENDTPEIDDFLNKYCSDRYSNSFARVMTKLWQDFMPIIELVAWSMEDNAAQTGNPIFTYVAGRADFNVHKFKDYKIRLGDRLKYIEQASDILLRIAEINPDDEQLKRDLFDIARTIISRYLDAAILKAQILYFDRSDSLKVIMDSAVSLMRLLADLLSAHSDYSLYDSLLKLQSVTDTNPNFEITLKRNSECMYCRSFIYENAQYLYLPELIALFNEVKTSLEENREINREGLKEEYGKIRDNYFALPFSVIESQKQQVNLSEICKKAAEIISKIPLN